MSFISTFKKVTCFVGGTVVNIAATSILYDLTSDIPTKNNLHKIAIKAGVGIMAGMITAASSKYIGEQIDEFTKDISVDAKLKDGLTIEIKSEK